MRNRTIKEMQAMTGASNKATAERLITAMEGAMCDFQEESDYTIWDWDGATYKGHDLVDGEEIHYLEVEAIQGGWRQGFVVMFEINEYDLGFMNDYYEAY